MFLFIKEKIQKFLIYLKIANAIHYVNGPTQLPPPLSKEEEEKVFKDLKNNDPNARDILITHNLRLVVYIAKNLNRVVLE